MGYDTEYSRRARDRDVVGLALREDRVIVTRDLGLHRRAAKRNLRSIYIPPDVVEVADMLALVAEELGLGMKFDKGNTRCPQCNSRLNIVPKAQIAHLVPPEVLNRYDTFWYCEKCQKAYWQGRHWKTINDVIETVRSRLRGGAGGEPSH